MTPIEKRTFVCSDIAKNNNRFWIISRFPNHEVVVNYGRVGQSGASETKNFSCEADAVKFFNGKIRDKLKVKTRRDSYTEIQILGDSVTTSPSKHVSDLAVEQIKTASDEVKKLIRWFSDINIHQITQSTQIKYDITDGTFRTPLGVIGPDCINRAKFLLDAIAAYNNKTEPLCIKLANEYLRLCPQDCGGSHVKIHVNDIFGTDDLLQKQADLLEGLEAAITNIKPVALATERVFNTKLDILQSNEKVEEVRAYYNKYSDGSRITNVYQVHIKDITDRFLTYGQSIGNIIRLWHGTSPSNLLSILKVGLIVPKSYSNGRRFLDGVYFSDRSSMSLNYTPTNLRDKNRYKYMFLSEVALGKYYEPNYNYNSLPAGYNSCWAEKNQSTSQIIVYNLNQFNLLYLLEIKD